MTGKIYIGVGIVLWLFAWAFHDLVLTIGGGIFFITGLLSLTAFNSGVESTTTHYRLYKRFFFFKTGEWRSIDDVHHILIRTYSYIHHYPYTIEQFTKRDARERVILYQVYLVRKHGYDKWYESDDFNASKEVAEQLAKRYNKKIEIKE